VFPLEFSLAGGIVREKQQLLFADREQDSEKLQLATEESAEERKGDKNGMKRVITRPFLPVFHR